ncbi:HEXXH motif-containing putative peptide modification protein [Kitasatospora sp. NPDC059577]|uniref:aKG-HExxH-type peptide beta-hydroxylase n=1 Tax=Kitasatospora sp. NPDC059577 TaxID=3346873 RepID=UPI00368AA046
MGTGQDEAVRVGMTPDGTAALVRSYHREVVRRLGPLPDGAPAPACLHPGLVWAADRPATGAGTPGDPADGPAAAPDPARIAGLLREPATTGLMPPLRHLTPDGTAADPDWCRWGTGQLRADIRRTGGTGDADFGTLDPTEGIATLEAARTTLRRVWPEAALETALLVRVIVHVRGGAFRSATLRPTFGAVYLGTSSVASPAAAFEALLHETGHHALYLRNVFERYVTNGDVLVSHPLRPDPRPVTGAVHAAHVLARMAHGLARWAAEPGAPPEAAERRDDALRRLRGTIAALEPVAEWTDGGRRYFDDLLRWEKELTAAHPL